MCALHSFYRFFERDQNRWANLLPVTHPSTGLVYKPNGKIQQKRYSLTRPRHGKLSQSGVTGTRKIALFRLVLYIYIYIFLSVHRTGNNKDWSMARICSCSTCNLKCPQSLGVFFFVCVWGGGDVDALVHGQSA